MKLLKKGKISFTIYWYLYKLHMYSRFDASVAFTRIFCTYHSTPVSRNIFQYHKHFSTDFAGLPPICFYSCGLSQIYSTCMTVNFSALDNMRLLLAHLLIFCHLLHFLYFIWHIKLFMNFLLTFTFILFLSLFYFNLGKSSAGQV